VAELPAPPWARAPQRLPRRRREPLTQEGIVEAALAVLDADGLDLLSMRHVARTLDTTAAALYWHVGSKDGLLDLIFDRVIGEQPVPDAEPDRWEEQVREVARTMRRAILGHRDIVRLSIGRVPMGPNALRYADRVLAILRSGGLPDEHAVAGLQLLFSIVMGFTIDETGDAPAGEPAGAIVGAYLASLPAEQFPHLVAVADHMAAGDADRRFELLVDFFVDGLAQRAG
jgi:AcrR family transcriptional regulator